MYPFFESIALLEGKIRNLNLHQQRVDRSLYHHYKNTNTGIQLDKIIQTIPYPKKGTLKVKVSYNSHAYQIEITPYRRKRWKQFKLIEDNSIQYPFKYTDRQQLERWKIGPSALILFVQHGEISDSEYANTIFLKDSTWYTPKNCILKGTMREKLLLENKIFEESIPLSQLKNYSHFKCINAMNSLEEAILYDIHVIPEIVGQIKNTVN